MLRLVRRSPGSTTCVNTVVKFSPPAPACSMNVKPTGVTTTLMSPAPAFPMMRPVPACVSMESKTVPAFFSKLLLFQGRTPFIPTCCRSLPPFALNTLSLKQGSSVTGRCGCGRLSLSKHGLECEQQKSSMCPPGLRLSVYNWRGMGLEMAQASGASGKSPPDAPPGLVALLMTSCVLGSNVLGSCAWVLTCRSQAVSRHQSVATAISKSFRRMSLESRPDKTHPRPRGARPPRNAAATSPNTMGPCPISIQVFFPDAPRSCDGMASPCVQAEARVRMPVTRRPRPSIGPGALQVVGHPRAAAAALLRGWWRGPDPAAVTTVLTRDPARDAGRVAARGRPDGTARPSAGESDHANRASDAHGPGE